MPRWFRSHVAKLENPKVQRLSDAHYRAWESLLCVAARFDGVLPDLSDTAFYLRRSAEETAELVEALIKARLFERTDAGIRPHDWDDWQYKSDVSTERVKRFRQRPRAVSATSPDSEPDSEPDPEAHASGAGAPPSAKAMFDEGVKLLSEAGCKPANARSLIGKWRRDAGDAAVMVALRAAHGGHISEPIAWITARLAAKPRESFEQRRQRQNLEIIRSFDEGQ